MANDSKKNARRRALRAAQVVTLGFALAGGGCYAQHDPGVGVEDRGPDASLDVADDAAVWTDAVVRPREVIADANSEDSGPGDAGVGDAGLEDADPGLPDAAGDAMADASTPTACNLTEDWGACCTEIDWPCDSENTWGCCAWGPYSPPEEGALPMPRSVAQRVLA